MDLENLLGEDKFGVLFLLDFVRQDRSGSKYVKDFYFALNLFKSFYVYMSVVKGNLDIGDNIDNLPEISLEQLKNLYSYNYAVYDYYDDDILNLDSLDVKHDIGHLHSYRASIARAAVDKVETDEEKLAWLNKALRANEKCSESFERTDRYQFLNQLSFKAEVEFFISDLVDGGKNYNCVKNAYLTNKQYVTEAIKDEIKEKDGTIKINSINCIDLALKLAILSFEEEKGKEMVVSWLDKGKKEIEKHMADPKTGYILTLYADESEKFGDGFSDLETKIFFLERSYEENIDSSKMIKKIDFIHHIMSLLNAGKVAKKLYDLTGNVKFKDLAIINYTTFANYFEKHPIQDNWKLYVKVTGILDEFRREKESVADFIEKKGRKFNKDRYKKSRRFKKSNRWQAEY